jgi:hypothetical protein
MIGRRPDHCVYLIFEKVVLKFSDLSDQTRFIELRVQ